jgi:hypothetical protein
MQKEEEDLRIPFYGVYWLLRPPDKMPPPTALTMRGSPSRRSFRTNDGAPLTMEARQNLGILVDVSCCSAIEVSIFNSDKYSGTVQVELVLSNTALRGRPSVSLGRLPVRSESRFRFFSAPGIVVEEKLVFPLPEALPFRQFDEFSVRFVTASMRADHAPRISVESFRLVRRRMPG